MPRKESFAWDKKPKKNRVSASKSKKSLEKRRSRTSPPPPKKTRKTSQEKITAILKKISNDKRRSSDRRKSSRESRKSKDRRRSSKSSRRKSKDRRRSSQRSRRSRKSKERRRSRRSSRASRKSKERRKSSDHRMSNPQQKRSISKVKVWQEDTKNQNRNNSWQAVPPAPEKGIRRKSKPHQEGMMEQLRNGPGTASGKRTRIVEEEEEEDDDDSSDDPLNLPKDPEIYMYDQFALSPEVKKFRPGCTCATAGRLSLWCKLLAWLELLMGLILILFKVSVMTTAHIPRMQVKEGKARLVDSVEMAMYGLAILGGLSLFIGASRRLKYLCLIHVLFSMAYIVVLVVTVVLYILFKVDIPKRFSELEGVWWYLLATKISWIPLFLWSLLLSTLLYCRIRRADIMNVEKPAEVTVSPQTYMTKVEMFLNV